MHSNPRWLAMQRTAAVQLEPDEEVAPTVQATGGAAARRAAAAEALAKAAAAEAKAAAAEAKAKGARRK